MQKYSFLIWGLLLFSTHLVSAQDYNTALGLRISPYYGVTIKHFLNSERAIEGILLTRRGGFGITGLYEVHTTAFKVPRLKAFGGIGGHVNVFDHPNRGFWNWDDDFDNGIRLSDETRMALGLDLILGLEYTLEELPFNIGLDWKPALNIIGDHGSSVNQFALSVRFVF